MNVQRLGPGVVLTQFVKFVNKVNKRLHGFHYKCRVVCLYESGKIFRGQEHQQHLCHDEVRGGSKKAKRARERQISAMSWKMLRCTFSRVIVYYVILVSHESSC